MRKLDDGERASFHAWIRAQGIDPMGFFTDFKPDGKRIMRHHKKRGYEVLFEQWEGEGRP